MTLSRSRVLYGFDATVPDIGMKWRLITQNGFGGICVQVPYDVAKYQFIFSSSEIFDVRLFQGNFSHSWIFIGLPDGDTMDNSETVSHFAWLHLRPRTSFFHSISTRLLRSSIFYLIEYLIYLIRDVKFYLVLR